MRYHLTCVRMAKVNNTGNMLARMWRKRNPLTLLVWMQTGATTLENSMEIPQEVKNRTTLWSSNCTTRYLPQVITFCICTYYHFVNCFLVVFVVSLRFFLLFLFSFFVVDEFLWCPIRILYLYFSLSMTGLGFLFIMKFLYNILSKQHSICIWWSIKFKHILE